MKISGVYKIINDINGHYYVGSSNDVRGRWRGHKSLLRKNKHHSPRLQRAWNKYGESSFTFHIEFVCSNYLYKEQLILDAVYGSISCYNVCPTSTGTAGYKHTDKFKEYIRSINTGRVVSEETRQLLSKKRGVLHHLYGKPLSQEHKQKLSRSHRGERSATNKLSTQQVLEIRQLYASDDYSQRKLASLYNVSRSCIKDIVTRKNWKHV